MNVAGHKSGFCSRFIVVGIFCVVRFHCVFLGGIVLPFLMDWSFWLNGVSVLGKITHFSGSIAYSSGAGGDRYKLIKGVLCLG